MNTLIHCSVCNKAAPALEDPNRPIPLPDRWAFDKDKKPLCCECSLSYREEGKIRIVSAAIMQGNRIRCIFPPARHHDIIRLLYGETGKTVTGEQGFMSSTGEFLDRETAREMALESGQCPYPRHCTDLFSEDMW